MCGDPTSEAKMVSIEIEIDDSLLFEIMKRAHEADLTLNRYLQAVIEDYLDELERRGAKK